MSCHCAMCGINRAGGNPRRGSYRAVGIRDEQAPSDKRYGRRVRRRREQALFVREHAMFAAQTWDEMLSAARDLFPYDEADNGDPRIVGMLNRALATGEFGGAA